MVVRLSLITLVAQYEEMLRTSDDPEGSYNQAKACATVVYYSSRMEAVGDPFVVEAQA